MKLSAQCLSLTVLGCTVIGAAAEPVKLETRRELSMYIKHHSGYPSNHVRRYVIRPDGFVSIQAPYAGGEMLTRPITFTGRRLSLNFATSAVGGLRVEIQTKRGQPIDGYRLDECPELIGDRIDHPIAWKRGGDLAELIGQTVRLRFVLRDADLYSLRFMNPG